MLQINHVISKRAQKWLGWRWDEGKNRWSKRWIFFSRAPWNNSNHQLLSYTALNKIIDITKVKSLSLNKCSTRQLNHTWLWAETIRLSLWRYIDKQLISMSCGNLWSQCVSTDWWSLQVIMIGDLCIIDTLLQYPAVRFEMTALILKLNWVDHPTRSFSKMAK